MDKETQLILLQKEISKLKQQKDSAANAKARVLADLEKTKKTLDDLTYCLQTVTESKQSAIEAIQEIKEKSKKIEVEDSNNVNGNEAWKLELEHTRKEHATAVCELNASKQQLTKIRQDFDATMEGKLAAFQQAAEAESQANQLSERVRELSREITAMQESVEQLKNSQTQNEQAKLVAEREDLIKSYKTSKEETKKKFLELREEADPKKIKNLETVLEEATEEIEVLQEKVKKVHAKEMDAVRLVTTELNEATKKLQEVAEEDNSLRSIVNSIRDEIKEVKRMQDELKQKEMEIEYLSANLNAELQKNKAEREEKTAMLEKELKECEQMRLEVKQLSEKTKNSRNEADEIKQNVNELKQEAKNARKAAEEAEKKLPLSLVETAKAKAAEKRALNEMNLSSENQEETSDSNPKKNRKVKLTVQGYEDLSKKVEEYHYLAEKKETEAKIQLETLNARKNEVDEKLKANLKAIEEIKAATDMALKNAEMAESAKIVVEVELRKWHQSEE